MLHRENNHLQQHTETVANAVGGKFSKTLAQSPPQQKGFPPPRPTGREGAVPRQQKPQVPASFSSTAVTFSSFGYSGTCRIGRLRQLFGCQVMQIHLDPWIVTDTSGQVPSQIPIHCPIMSNSLLFQQNSHNNKTRGSVTSAASAWSQTPLPQWVDANGCVKIALVAPF